MISLLLLSLTLLLSGIMVRIGAIALEITGMPHTLASFQALAAYTGVGFGSKEADYALANPQRRKIIQTLIQAGSAGVITTIASLGGTLVSSPQLVEKFFGNASYITTLWGFHLKSSHLVMLAVVGTLLLIYRVLANPAITRLIQEMISQWLVQSQWVTPALYQEILTTAHGFVLMRVEICENNPMYGKRLQELDLKDKRIRILLIERLRESIIDPSETLRIEIGDRILAFGPTVSISESCCVRAKQADDEEKGSDRPLPPSTVAPDFALPDPNGQIVRLSDYKDKSYVILVFYPLDRSFTCTSQLKKFTNRLAELQEMGVQVLAINPQSKREHLAFQTMLHSNIPILSDPDRKACKAYKALMLGGLLVNRSVYVINKEGRIIYAERGNPAFTDVLHPVQAERFPEELASCATGVCPV